MFHNMLRMYTHNLYDSLRSISITWEGPRRSWSAIIGTQGLPSRRKQDLVPKRSSWPRYKKSLCFKMIKGWLLYTLVFTNKIIPVYFLWFKIYSTTYMADLSLFLMIFSAVKGIVEGFFTNFWRKNLQAVPLKVQLS